MAGRSHTAESNVSPAAAEWIDVLCDRFERAWQEAPPPPRIEDFLTDSSAAALPAAGLLRELVMIVLVYRWRQGDQAGPDSATIVPETALTDAGLPARPRLEDYAARFSDLAERGAIDEEMAVCEFRLRHRYGDEPPVEEYRRRFPHLVEALKGLSPPPPPPRLMVKCFDRRRLVFHTELRGKAEIGRQRSSEPEPFCRVDRDSWPRIIIAGLRENSISREHVLLEPQPGGLLRVTNVSKKGIVGLDGRQRLEPGQLIILELPSLITIGDKAVRLEAAPSIDESEIQLESLAEPTLRPGMSFSQKKPLLELTPTGHQAATEMLIHWLRATMDVFQSAASRSDFLPRAAQAVAEILQLDLAAVLSFRDGRWKTETLQGPAAERSGDQWRPSETILEKVRQEGRTFRNVPAQDTAGTPSLMGVLALVAAPILDAQGDVVGALYGDRRRAIGPSGQAEISELEAVLVELLSYGVSSGLARVEQEKAAIAARVKFEQFFSTELAQAIERDPTLLEGKDADVSVLFCDIRGFSRISERLGPARTLDWLSDVMGDLSDCVIEHDGVLVDYIGDELMAMWGAPAERDDHATLACRAALVMCDRLPGLNDRWQSELGEEFSFGIGINSGPARVGNTGTHRKFKYTPLGNTVNLASRVQGVNKFMRTNLLITGQTAARLGDEFLTRRICRVRVLNIREPIHLHEVAVAATDDWRRLKEEHEAALAAFEGRDLPTATRILGNLLSTNPDDGPVLLLLSRAVDAMSDPRTDFDAVWNLDRK